jgi:hypothetical protein
MAMAPSPATEPPRASEWQWGSKKGLLSLTEASWRGTYRRRTRQGDSRRWTSTRESAGLPDNRQVTSRRRSRASVREEGSSRRACWFSLEIKSSIPEESVCLAAREVFRGPLQAVSWPFTRVRFGSIFMARTSTKAPIHTLPQLFYRLFRGFSLKWRRRLRGETFSPAHGDLSLSWNISWG